MMGSCFHDIFLVACKVTSPYPVFSYNSTLTVITREPNMTFLGDLAGMQIQRQYLQIMDIHNFENYMYALAIFFAAISAIPYTMV